MNWHDIFSYDANRGVLVWKVRPREWFKTHRAYSTVNARCVNKDAGTFSATNSGVPICVQIRLRKKTCMAHRIIWEMANGPIPEGMLVDHVDGNAWNNVLSNLRLATKAHNAYNSRRPRNNTSGHKGVSWNASRRKWVACIATNKKNRCLGAYASLEDAAAAYATAAKDERGSFARLG